MEQRFGGVTIELIEEFAQLQRALLTAFAAVYPNVLGDETFVVNCPLKGDVICNGSRWFFTKHGTGIRFCDSKTGVCVDAHASPHDIDMLDAWRILSYIDSIQPNAEYEERDIETLMTQLALKQDSGLMQRGVRFYLSG
jgi:hypothetical protein